jgi:hypothetical protein
MAKYKLQAIQDIETITPASEMIFTSLITGEEVGKRLPVPESRHFTPKGHIYTARNIKDRDNLLKTGKWVLTSP